MREITSDELNTLKKIELEILNDVDRVCRKYNISYSLAYGTLIGAVRHKGFIPWDDDIDIMMERSQYKKFVSIVDSELSEDFEFIDAERDRFYGHMFGKVMAKNTLMLEETIRDSKTKAGVFIDIFPFDVVPEDGKRRKRQRKIAQLIQGMLLCQGKYHFEQTRGKFIVYRCCGAILRLIPKRFFCVLYRYNAEKYAFCSECSGVANLTGRIVKTIYSRTYFDKYIDHEFEGKTFMVIEKYDNFLTDRYGDYMKLPPESEQVPHHYVVAIDLSGWRKY